jgi:hypothetical protein
MRPIAKSFGILIEKNGFDDGPVACGVTPSPDFGYFELADRFWRASVCIYSFGSTYGFWERGAGFAEPWLFNARHAVELYLKGFLLNAIWFEQLQDDPYLSSEKAEFANLRKALGKPHNLVDLYNDYATRIMKVVQDWHAENFPEVPDIDSLLLKSVEIEMLKELDETDRTSFRFRYPSLKDGDFDSLQRLNWFHEPSKLFPATGLPKEAGYFFNHVNVINHLNQLINELKNVADYFNGYADYQGVLNDYWNDYLSQFGDDGYAY